MKFPLLFIIVTLALIGCGKREESPKDAKSKIAAQTVSIPQNLIDEFSGEKSLKEIKTLTSFGPRPPES
ncbi:hypothetical protein N9024_01050, partial [bacterium]|nr:hypothetical protein [bacterium]